VGRMNSQLIPKGPVIPFRYDQALFTVTGQNYSERRSLMGLRYIGCRRRACLCFFKMTTPLFIEDVSVARKGRFQLMLEQVSGPSAGTRHFNSTESESGMKAATAPGEFDPAELDVVKELAKFHPLVTWKKLRYAVIPGPGAFGRTVTAHYGWVPPGQKAPKTRGEFANLPGYTFQVFGGVADPNFEGRWLDAPFSQSRHAVICSGLVGIASCMKMVWFVEEADVGATKGTGVRVFFRFEGEFEVFGQFY